MCPPLLPSVDQSYPLQVGCCLFSPNCARRQYQSGRHPRLRYYWQRRWCCFYCMTGRRQPLSYQRMGLRWRPEAMAQRCSRCHLTSRPSRWYYRVGNQIPSIPFLIIIPCFDLQQSQKSMVLPKFTSGDAMPSRLLYRNAQNANLDRSETHTIAYDDLLQLSG